jgi:hypothetical protein
MIGSMYCPTVLRRSGVETMARLTRCSRPDMHWMVWPHTAFVVMEYAADDGNVSSSRNPAATNSWVSSRMALVPANGTMA